MQAFSREVLSDVFERGASMTLPPLPGPNRDCHVENGPYVGTYEKLSSRIEVTEEASQLVATLTQKGGWIPAPPA